MNIIKSCIDIKNTDPGPLLFFVKTMPDKVILDHKKSYLVYFENFHFL